MKLRLSPSSTLANLVLIGLTLLCLFIDVPSHAQRLSQEVRPQHYNLALTPNLRTATFTGVETIDVITSQPTRAITLNSVDITFQSATITARGKEEVAAVTFDRDKEQATLTAPHQIPAGKATLSIRFSGILNSELRGFYLSKTSRRNYAVTQFEPTDARRAFPNFDEPAFKATFDVSLVVDKTDTAISNTSVVSDTPGPGDGKHTLKFATTPKMSTYLVAFLVGDFQCIHGEQDGVIIGVCSPPDKIALTGYSLKVAKSILHYYNNYFGIPYPLKKLDLVGIPDFEAGAMENFGAITFREIALLIDPAKSSLGSKKSVETVIAHEMAHQWFGDLVTMQWWNNIWLNEGFATWMSYKPIAAMHSDWHLDEEAISDTDYSLELDSRAITRAIRARADTPDEINQMFDGITYDKAAAILLMVENYVGTETFRRGVHNYLAAHLYGNATAEDFWRAQTAVSHKPIDKIMESFVAQPGAPILTFGTPSNGLVDVTQRRFVSGTSTKADFPQKWTLPVCFKAAKGRMACDLLASSRSQLKIPFSPLFYPDAGGTGYYRTSFTPEIYKSLVKYAETELNPSERIRLVGDRWAQVWANDASVGDFLDLAKTLKEDPSAEVMEQLLYGIETSYNRIPGNAEERLKFAYWIRATFSRQLAQLGPPSPNDTPTKQSLRTKLFELSGVYGKDPNVLEQANEMAKKFIADPSSLHTGLGYTGLMIAARNGDASLFDQLQNIYETSPDPVSQQFSLALLSEFEKPALVRRSLEYAISGKVRNQDAINQITRAMQIPSNRELAWSFVQENWDKVQRQFTPIMGRRLVASTGSFCSAGARAEIEKFFASHTVPDSNVSLGRALDRINECSDFRQVQEPNLRQWFTANPQS